jgi:hypothetical protein
MAGIGRFSEAAQFSAVAPVASPDIASHLPSRFPKHGLAPAQIRKTKGLEKRLLNRTAFAVSLRRQASR